MSAIISVVMKCFCSKYLGDVSHAINILSAFISIHASLSVQDIGNHCIKCATDTEITQYKLHQHHRSTNIKETLILYPHVTKHTTFVKITQERKMQARNRATGNYQEFHQIKLQSNKRTPKLLVLDNKLFLNLIPLDKIKTISTGL